MLQQATINTLETNEKIVSEKESLRKEIEDIKNHKGILELKNTITKL